MKKVIVCLAFVFILTLLFLLITPSKASASILFQDNFNNENSNQWTPISGQNLWKVQNGKYGARITTSSTIIRTVAGSISTPNYSIEFDMLPIEGEDKNIEIRKKDDSIIYGIHFNYTGGGMAEFGKAGPHQAGWPKRINYFFPNNETAHVKIILENQHIQFFINDIKLFDEIDTDYKFTTNEQVILIISTGGTYPTQIWFDNVVVKSLDNALDLDVPLIKQTSDPWKSQTYDSANKWNPSDPTINSWGCALTSAVMILNYHGITKLPDGTNLDPGSLNKWLLSQKDGYVKDGYVNWLAITRLSKKAKTINGITKFDALEFFKVNKENKTTLISDIKNEIPDILEEPGHFIVAKGTVDDTFLINDPFYDRTDLATGYSNKFLTIGRFIPSFTDLSYIMAVTDPKIDLTLIDTASNEEGESFVQEALTNDSNSSQANTPIKLAYFKKPNNGNFQLYISAENSKLFKIQTYLYDKNGITKIIESNGIAGENGNVLDINVDKDNLDNSNVEKKVTFNIFLNDINQARNLKLINNDILKKILINHVKNTQKDILKGKKNSAMLKLAMFESLLKVNRGKMIKEEAYNILLYDTIYLKNHL